MEHHGVNRSMDPGSTVGQLITRIANDITRARAHQPGFIRMGLTYSKNKDDSQVMFGSVD